MVDREVFKLTTEVYAFSFSMHPPLILPMYLYGFCNIFWFLQLCLCIPRARDFPRMSIILLPPGCVATDMEIPRDGADQGG